MSQDRNSTEVIVTALRKLVLHSTSEFMEENREALAKTDKSTSTTSMP